MSILPLLLTLIKKMSQAFISFSNTTRPFNMTPGVTAVSRDIFSLHMTIFWICVGIGLIVFGVLFYAIIFHRKSRGAKPANFHESTIVEIFWTVIPFIILISMAYPATKVLIRMDNTEDSDITIKIIGYRWKWEYEYKHTEPGKKLQFLSNLSSSKEQTSGRDVRGIHYLREVDRPLVVPINKKIRFLTTSVDVIHSWWVPDLGIKRDCVPGYINEAWAYIEKPGIYRGQCAELCGDLHGFMPIVVEAKTLEEYEAWLKQNQEDIKS